LKSSDIYYSNLSYHTHKFIFSPSKICLELFSILYINAINKKDVKILPTCTVRACIGEGFEDGSNQCKLREYLIVESDRSVQRHVQNDIESIT